MNQTITASLAPSKWVPFLALCLGFFMVIIDVTIVNVALPNMAKTLHTNISGLQWIVAGYALTFSCLLLSAGSLGDRLGAKNIFLGGLILFVATSFVCGIATTLWSLIAARLLQGASAALLVPTSMALINTLFPDKKERAHAIGIWAGIGGFAGAAGPMLGGMLTTWLSWRAVFFINIPIGLFAGLLTIKYVINPVSNPKDGLDISGQIFIILSITALAFGLIEAGNLGWSSNITISAFVIFILSLIIFLFIEHRSMMPMLPLWFFKSKSFSVLIALGMIMNLGGYGQLFVLSLYFQQIREYSVLMTGFALIPFMGMGVLGSYLGGKVTSIIGPRMPILLGSFITTIGYFSLLIADVHTPSYVMLIPSLAAIGFGLTFLMPAATFAIIQSLPAGQAGLAAGAFNTSRQLGSLLGVAILGTLIHIASSFTVGMHLGLIISGITLLCCCFAVVLYIR